MSIPLTVNGVVFPYPQQFDKNWGPTLTNWSSAVTTGMLQKAGGAFTLAAETDFGASYGLKTLYVKSEESNIAATGILRLGNASSGIAWRNAANSADLALTVNSSNLLTFNGTAISAAASLTNGHILVGNASNQPADVAMSGDITISNTGVTAIGAGKVLDASIGSGAAITLSKLAALSNSQLVVTNGSGVLASQASPTLTELGYVAGVGSAIQTQINGLLPLSGGTLTGVLNMGGKRISSVGLATTAGDVIPYGQAQVRGSTANSGGSAQDVTQGTISTPDLRANAITNAQTVSTSSSPGVVSAITVQSISITTLGGPVFLTGNVSFLVGANNHVSISCFIYRSGQTQPVSGSSVNFSTTAPATSGGIVQCMTPQGVDAPPAGTYTYLLAYQVPFGAASVYLDNAFTAVELRR